MAFGTAKHLPPVDGSVNVLPGFVDFHAEHNPTLPWVKYPFPTQPGRAQTITFLEFAEATHRAAHALRPVGTGTDGEVVAVVISCDTVQYLALLAGMIRAGLVVSIRKQLGTLIADSSSFPAFPDVASQLS